MKRSSSFLSTPLLQTSLVRLSRPMFSSVFRGRASPGNCRRLRFLSAVASSGFALLALLCFEGVNWVHGAPFVSANEFEFTSRGDFNGDGLQDVVIVERKTGQYRLGYQLSPGNVTWIGVRESGVKDLSGFAVGRFLRRSRDALAFTSADLNEIKVVEAGNPLVAGPEVSIEPPALGMDAVAPVNLGKAAPAGLDGLFATSIYNDPLPNLGHLLCWQDGQFKIVGQVSLGGEVHLANQISLKAGQTAYLATVVQQKGANAFQLQDFRSGKAVTLLNASDLPAGTRYAVGRFLPGSLPEFLFYQAGVSNFTLATLRAPSANTLQFALRQQFAFSRNIRQIFSCPGAEEDRLLVIHDPAETAGFYRLTADAGPVLLKLIEAPEGESFFGAVARTNGVQLFSGPEAKTFAARFEDYAFQRDSLERRRSGDLAVLDETTIAIRRRIARSASVTNADQMRAYTNTIPGSQVQYSMVPIPGGEFLMGSPDNEPGHRPDEAPQHQVKIEPFWMGRYEVTWDEFELFMYPEEEQRFRADYPTAAAVNELSDAVARPTKPYMEMSFGMGRYGYPAIAMTQHAANKYCEWLSAKTGQFYRLPTEAEWEYASRAGTTTPYFFGNDPAQLGAYAWFGANSNDKYQKVGQKKPNPWGLYDIYGNVLEWTLDGYDPGFYRQFKGKVALEPWCRPVTPYPLAARGGSWDDSDPADFRSAARRGSDPAWKMQDPQLPKSIWYFSDAPFIGFRIVRPLKVPSTEKMFRAWNNGVEVE